MNQIFQIILYLGAVQGMLLSVFLFSIKVNKISNRLLGLLTLFWGVIVGIFGFQLDGFHLTYPHLLKIAHLFLYNLFPLLYLQVKYLLSDHIKFNRRDLLHFLPTLIIALLNIGFYLKSGEEKLDLVKIGSTLYYYVLSIIQNGVIAVQGIIYSLLALKLLSKYKQKVREYQSNVDKMILKVQYTGISLSLFAWIIGIIGIYLEYFGIGINFDLFIFVYLTLVLIIYIISYTALQSPEIFKIDEKQMKLEFTKNHQNNFSGESTQVNTCNSSESRKKNAHYSDHVKSEEIEKKLIDFINSEKPYLNPELSLQELADNLDVKKYSLSIVINQKYNKNFYEFINQYRIEEVKSMMSDPDNRHLKLMSLAYDAGFNSKATFNRIFKQMTNMTPSQFISSQKIA